MEKVKKITMVSLIFVGSLCLMAGSGNGGNSGQSSVDKGSLYGDLYVILRDINGVPILDANGCVQPISGTTGDLLSLDEECELLPGNESEVMEVDFGRLNVGRSPSVVMEASFDEAISNINSATSIDLDPAGRLLLTIDGLEETIDSPKQNLALYMKLMSLGHWITTDTSPLVRGNGQPGTNGSSEEDGPSSKSRPVLSYDATCLLANLGFEHLGDSTNTTQDLNNNELLLAASLLAGAADKTGTLTLDAIIYINSIYGINQKGFLPGEVPDKTYFDFTNFTYFRSAVYENRRDSQCSEGNVWTLVQQDDSGIYWKAECQNIMSAIFVNPPTDYTNVGGFVQAADDALRVIEFIHNYYVPELSL